MKNASFFRAFPQKITCSTMSLSPDRLCAGSLPHTVGRMSKPAHGRPSWGGETMRAEQGGGTGQVWTATNTQPLLHGPHECGPVGNGRVHRTAAYSQQETGTPPQASSARGAPLLLMVFSCDDSLPFVVLGRKSRVPSMLSVSFATETHP